MDVIAILALVVSAIALFTNFISNKYERSSFEDQVYERFAQMWFDMDQVFIKHPYMHKYFYRNGETGEYAILEESDDNFELGLCIAEMFNDVFQYTEPLEEYLKAKDKASYVDYKKMILNSPIVQTTMKRNNWHKKK